MKWFNNLKIASKLIICFIIVAFIAGAVGVIGIVNLKKLAANDTVLYEDNTKGIDFAGNASINYQRLRYNIAKMINLRDEITRSDDVEKLKALRDSVNSSLSDYRVDSADIEHSELLNTLKLEWDSYCTYINKIIEYAEVGRYDDMNTMFFREADDAGTNLQDNFDKLISLNENNAEIKANDNKEIASNAQITMIVVIIIGILLALSLGILLSRIINKPIKKLNASMEKISDGDIRIEIDIDTNDEFGELAGSCRKIINSIRLLIQEADKLTNAATEGQLSVRGDITRLKGGYKDIINGFNNTLDVINKPLDESEVILGKIALNDYTLQMTGQYNGYFENFAKAINEVRTRLLSVQDAFERVGRGDTSRLDEFEKAGKRSENDKLMPACVSAMSAINGIIVETGKIADAAANGDLSIRGNKDKFEGGYKDIIAGFNRTLDTISEPVDELSEVMLRLADKDLTLSMQGEYKGEFAKMKEAVNNTIDSLNDTMNEIKSAAEQVASGAKQISDSSMALSQGATEQASSIEELTASLEEISSQTKLNAENAGKANELAGNARANAAKGNDQMKDMLNAMDEINVSSSNIYKIIKVIDDIAFQTNILALNAAVEAARAGQHGKGFAVVAEEVRTLAARSANAAKETADLIEGSIHKVEAGTKIAKDTAEALVKIVDEVEKAADLVNAISIASSEQSAGIGQINQGIMQVSEVVQTNSATSEESAAASEELSSQAETMRDITAMIKLKKINKSYGELDEISPEVLKMLENMSGKKTNNHEGFNSTKSIGKRNIEQAKEKKIILSDREFGKY